MIQEAKNYDVEDKKFLKKAEILNALDYCVYKITNSLKQTDVNSKVSSQDNDRINSAITIASNFLDSNKEVEIDVLEGHLKELDREHVVNCKVESLIVFIIGNALYRL
ncbi:heat shock protein 70 kDa, partial [Trifolium pratense]